MSLVFLSPFLVGALVVTVVAKKFFKTYSNVTPVVRSAVDPK
jgi:hypothetical protein